MAVTRSTRVSVLDSGLGRTSCPLLRCLRQLRGRVVVRSRRRSELVVGVSNLFAVCLLRWRILTSAPVNIISDGTVF